MADTHNTAQQLHSKLAMLDQLTNDELIDVVHELLSILEHQHVKLSMQDEAIRQLTSELSQCDEFRLLLSSGIAHLAIQPTRNLS